MQQVCAFKTPPCGFLGVIIDLQRVILLSAVALVGLRYDITFQSAVGLAGRAINLEKPKLNNSALHGGAYLIVAPCALHRLGHAHAVSLDERPCLKHDVSQLVFDL